MGLSQWRANTRYYFEHLPVGQAMKATTAELALGAYRRVTPYLPQQGTNVYDRDWDVLVVMDTCRADALQEVADEYEFLPEEVDTITSVGSKTREWMAHTFTEERSDAVADTLYVTYNPNSEDALSAEPFCSLYEVWRTAWYADAGGVPASAVTDHAITAAREHAGEYDRLIVHYKEPHQPYPELEGFDAHSPKDDDANDRSGVFGSLIEGDHTHEEVWNGYLDHLRSGLDEVERLLDNVDGQRVAITADHGDCFGEWGLYGHPGSAPVPELVRVPWVETAASDSGDSRPEIDLAAASRHGEGGDVPSVDDQLEALGYQ